MSTVLYRKYRSQDFDQLIGQDHITKILKNAIKKDKLSQAFLFVGSRGTGKTSTARILSKAVNCLDIKKDGNPCGKCSICKAISDGQFLDLIEIDAASNRGIDQIRELKEKIEFSPTEGRFKVYIIDEVHMLTTEAFNALLKTLEEPPAHVIFILATTDVHKLPPTILSRCQRYDFRLGTDIEIEKAIKTVADQEKIDIKKDALALLVQNAKGSYRDAMSLLDVVYSGQLKEGDSTVITKDEVSKVLGLPDIDVVYGLLKSLLVGDGSNCLDILHNLESSGANLQQFVSFVLETLRVILTEKIRGNLSEMNAFAKDISMRDLMTLIRLFLDAEGKMKYANDQLLVLEMIIPEMMSEEKLSDSPKIVNTDVKNKIPKEVVENSVKEEEAVSESHEEEDEEEDSTNDDTSDDSIVETGDVNLDSVQKGWDNFIREVKPFNGHLYAFLGSAKLISFDNGVLNIQVPFQFHKDRIEVPKSREVISTTFRKCFGTNCKICCEVNENVKPKKKSTPDFVLRNIPEVKKQSSENNQSNGGNNFKQSRKITAEVEAIFDGM
jgi:DNA polymerase-3 subunit gamma/tau